MNKINIEEKILEINKRIQNLKLENISKKNKNYLTFKLHDYLEAINETLDQFEKDNIDQFKINKEIEMKISENNQIKEIIDIFGPLILSYQLKKINKKYI